jgi:DNA-binding MurR/RpiR family transcriptional regulator
MDKRGIEKRIEEHYPGLPPMLQRAARYVVDNPREVALNSMRAVASSAGLQASAMHRLARQLGFDGYEAMRAVYRDWLGSETGSFAERATELQKRGAGDKTGDLIRDLLHADGGNLERMADPAVMSALKTARDVLAQARHIYVVGLRSLFPAAFYFNYACGMFLHNTTLLTGTGGIFADELRGAGPDDALVVFSYDPYTRGAVSAVAYAHAQGLSIVAITDSLLSPIAAQAEAAIIASNATPSLFPSVVPAMEAAQILAALLIASGGQASLREVEKSEAQLRQFAVYLKDAG